MRAIVSLTFVLTVALTGAARAEIELSCDRTAQEMRGFGTALNHWKREIHALYRQPEFVDRYVHDLGATLVRIPLHPVVLPDPVADPAAIHRRHFDHESRFVAPVLEFARAASRANPGEVRVVASVWSPPGWMKTTGSAKGGGHLRPDRRAHFARYLVEWVRLLEERYAIRLYALSIQNEPHFAQEFESCVYTPEAYRDTLAVVGRAFAEAGLDTRFFGPEDMTHVTERWRGFVETTLEDADAGPFLQVLASHGLSRGDPDAFGALRRIARRFDRELWMTETSGDEPDWSPGDRHAPPLDTFALEMHRALTRGDVSAWIYWQITAAPGWGRFSLMEHDQPTPKYHVARHWYRFVRPGARRLVAPASAGGLDVEAFHHREDGTLTLVLLNRTFETQSLDVAIDCPGTAGSDFALWRTSAREQVARLPDVPVRGGRLALRVPPRSLVTLRSPAASAP